VLTLVTRNSEGHLAYRSQSEPPRGRGTTVGGSTDDPRREGTRTAAACHPASGAVGQCQPGLPGGGDLPRPVLPLAPAVRLFAYRWLRGPATTCRRTGPSSSGSRSGFESVFQSRPRFHQMSQQLCAHRHLEHSTPLKHAPLKFPEHSLCYIRSSMCSVGEEDHPDPARRQGHLDHRPPRVTPRDRRARGRPPHRSGT